MRKLKVMLFVTSIDNRSGGTATFLKLLAEAMAEDADVTVVTGKTPHPLVIQGTTIKFFNLSVTGLARFGMLIKRFLKHNKPDVLHINGIWEPSNAVIQKAAQKLNIPVIISPHGMLEPWIINRNKLKKKIAMTLYQHKSLQQATCLHATAPSEQDNIRTLGYGEAVVIENGIETDHIAVKKSWEKTGTILFLSRVNPKKGLEFLIEAAGSLKKELKGYNIIIAGEGDAEYIASLRQQAEAAGAGSMVSFMGGVYGNDKWSLYRQADVFVLPTHSENFGMVIAEALICGTPVITTTGAPWQELEERKCGWWIDIGTDPLIRAVKEFLNVTEEDLRQMGHNGVRLVRDKYTARAMGKKMIELYSNLPAIATGTNSTSSRRRLTAATENKL